MIDIKRNLLFFDTETTGILKDTYGNIVSNGSLIQLAYRKISNFDKIDENLFFNTDTKIEIGSQAVHGIYKKLLLEKSGGKYLEDIVKKDLSNVFKNNIIIAHNIDFDLDILHKSGISFSDQKIDTLKIAKIMLSEGVLFNDDSEEPEYLNLQYLRYFFKLYEILDKNGNKENTTAHDAFGDVVVIENVFYKIFFIIKNNLSLSNDETIDLMIQMSNKQFIMIKTMRFGKYRGKTFEEIYNIDKSYLEWILKSDFTDDIKYTCRVWLGDLEDQKFFNN